MIQILVGIGAGGGWAAIGAMNAKAKGDDLKLRKFMKSVLVGACIGGCLTYQGTDVNLSTLEGFATTSALYVPLAGVAEKLSTLLFRIGKKILPRFRKKFQWYLDFG